MLFENSFYGDSFRWWYGNVVNTVNPPDPLLLGRVQVRIKGVHGPETEDRDLPWASCILPTTEGGISGVGRNPWLQDQAAVIGFFLDGTNSQLPVVLGPVYQIEGNIRGLNSGYDTSTDRVPQNTGGPINPSLFTNTSFTATSPEAKEAIESKYGNISDEEFDNLIKIIHAESGSSGNQLEIAYVAATVMNRRRDAGTSVMQILSIPYQFEPVTGHSGNGPPNSKFTNGPSGSREQIIYKSLVDNIYQTPSDMWFFASNSPAAYTGSITRQGFIDSMTNENRSLNIIGETMFFIGGPSNFRRG